MPGPVSESAPTPPICKCGHYKRVHNPRLGCATPGCDCQDYVETDLYDTPLGEALDAFVDEANDETIGKLLSQWVKAGGGAKRMAEDS